MFKPVSIFSGISLLFLAVAVHADHGHEQLFNKVNLQAEAQREIPNDEMTVIMAVEHQGESPPSLADRVNKDMAWTLEQVKKASAVTAKTRAYSTQPQYRNRIISGWRVRQELELRTGDFAGLTQLIGQLQERLQVVQMGFSPAAETRIKHENELIEAAMARFKERAEIVQGQMDGRDYRIVELHINTGGGYRPMMRMSEFAVSAADTVAAPAIEAGDSTMQVTVSGSVQFY